jgi:hypothetical protein
MLLEALKEIPGTIQIVPGQCFHENDEEKAEYWQRAGFARRPGGPNSRGWADGLRWDGFSVAILASGESLSVEQCEAVRAWRGRAANRKVIAINTTFRRAPWADLLYACDATWWAEYLEEVRRDFAGELWTQDSATAQKNAGVKFIRSDRGKGLCKKAGIVNQGANSGYQAIGLAYWSGSADVFLLGYDMRGGHWHGNHPPKLQKNNRFDVFLTNFTSLAIDVEKEAGFAVVNCTPKSSLKAFPVKPWQEAFA